LVHKGLLKIAVTVFLQQGEFPDISPAVSEHRRQYVDDYDDDYDDYDGYLVDEGSDRDGSSRDQSNNPLTSSATSSSSSMSDSDSDDLMVSQELRPGFSADRHTNTGGGRNLDDDRNHSLSEVDRHRDFVLDSNGPVGVPVQ